MHHELIFAGFGGQGVLLAGHILAWAANLEGKATAWSPSYGPEMRGGSSHCTVIVSLETIGSPIVVRPDIEVIMDEPSLDIFLPKLKPGGLLIINSSIVRKSPSRDDIRRLAIPANRIAEEMGDARSANVVMLGVLTGLVPLVEEASIQRALVERWGRDEKLLEINRRALRAGMAEAAKAK